MKFLVFFFFFNDTATTEIYTLSLHDALPIFGRLLAILSRPQTTVARLADGSPSAKRSAKSQENCGRSSFYLTTCAVSSPTICGRQASISPVIRSPKPMLECCKLGGQLCKSPLCRRLLFLSSNFDGSRPAMVMREKLLTKSYSEKRHRARSRLP